MRVRFPTRKQEQDDSDICVDTQRQFLTMAASAETGEYVFTIAKPEGLALTDFLESRLELGTETYTGYKDDLQTVLQ